MKTEIRDRGAGLYHFRYRLTILDDSLGRWYIDDLTPEMYAWMSEHVGEDREAYALLGDSILFHRFEDALAFKMYWS